MYLKQKTIYIIHAIKKFIIVKELEKQIKLKKYLMLLIYAIAILNILNCNMKNL